MRRSAFLLVLLLLGLGAHSAHAASILPVSDGRVVDLQADPTFPFVPVILTPLVPFAHFDASAGVIGGIGQDSTVTSSEMFGRGGGSADGGGGTLGHSTFEIDFQVDVQTGFTLSGDLQGGKWNDPEIDLPQYSGVSLVGAGVGTLFATEANGPFATGGMLLPGVAYTLNLFAEIPGENYDEASWRFGLVVPEPASGTLLGCGMVLLGLRVAGRTRCSPKRPA